MSEAPHCRVCGSDRTSPRFPGSELPLHRCRSCGAVFRAEAVTDKDLLEIYDKKYYLETWPGSLGRFFEDFDPQKHHKTRFFIKQLSELEKITGGPGRLLDVGCANGVFPWLAKERGWQAMGVEISPFAAEQGRKQFGLDIVEGGIEDVDPSEPFDAITFWDTIEHLPDPAAALRAARDRLKPGGLCAVLTPDVESLVNQLVHALHRIAPKHSAGLLETLYHKDHLTSFDRNSLCMTLIDHGFTIHWIETYDEDPRDTEAGGLTLLAVWAAHLAGMVLQRKHELLVWARKAAA